MNSLKEENKQLRQRIQELEEQVKFSCDMEEIISYSLRNMYVNDTYTINRMYSICDAYHTALKNNKSFNVSSAYKDRMRIIIDELKEDKNKLCEEVKKFEAIAIGLKEALVKCLPIVRRDYIRSSEDLEKEIEKILSTSTSSSMLVKLESWESFFNAIGEDIRLGLSTCSSTIEELHHALSVKIKAACESEGKEC